MVGLDVEVVQTHTAHERALSEVFEQLRNALVRQRLSCKIEGSVIGFKTFSSFRTYSC